MKNIFQSRGKRTQPHRSSFFLFLPLQHHLGNYFNMSDTALRFLKVATPKATHLKHMSPGADTRKHAILMSHRMANNFYEITQTIVFPTEIKSILIIHSWRISTLLATNINMDEIQVLQNTYCGRYSC